MDLLFFFILLIFYKKDTNTLYSSISLVKLNSDIYQRLKLMTTDELNLRAEHLNSQLLRYYEELEEIEESLFINENDYFILCSDNSLTDLLIKNKCADLKKLIEQLYKLTYDTNKKIKLYQDKLNETVDIIKNKSKDVKDQPYGESDKTSNKLKCTIL